MVFRYKLKVARRAATTASCLVLFVLLSNTQCINEGSPTRPSRSFLRICRVFVHLPSLRKRVHCSEHVASLLQGMDQKQYVLLFVCYRWPCIRVFAACQVRSTCPQPASARRSSARGSTLRKPAFKLELAMRREHSSGYHLRSYTPLSTRKMHSGSLSALLCCSIMLSCYTTGCSLLAMCRLL